MIAAPNPPPRPVHPVRALRAELGWTQDALARAAGFFRGQLIYNYESWRSRPYRRHAVTLAQVFEKHLGRPIDPDSLRPEREGVQYGLPTE